MEEQEATSSDEAVESGAFDEAPADSELERSGDRGGTAEGGALDEEGAADD